jgi:hypothetical protein
MSDKSSFLAELKRRNVYTHGLNADESISLSDLLTCWEWDPLRNDPRFQKILTAPEPKTTH